MTTAAARRIPPLFIVMLDLGTFGHEAIVHPEVDRAEVISRINDGNYPRENVTFIQFVHDGRADDVTAEIMGEVQPREREAA